MNEYQNENRMAPQCHPNMIWVFADQLRAHALGCNGDPNVHTQPGYAFPDRHPGGGRRFGNAPVLPLPRVPAQRPVSSSCGAGS